MRNPYAPRPTDGYADVPLDSGADLSVLDDANEHDGTWLATDHAAAYWTELTSGIELTVRAGADGRTRHCPRERCGSTVAGTS